MALRLAEVEPRDYLFVCTPTGAELPPMFAHFRRLGELLGQPVTPVVTQTLDGLVAHYNAVPNWRMRWCTRQLKIEPFKAFLLAHRPATAYVGLRADEEGRAGAVYGEIDGIAQRFPLREWGWGLREVRGYLERRGVAIPQRTDCAQCFFQTLGEWWNLWREYPDLYAAAEAQEAQTGHTYRSDQRDTWPANLEGLRQRFEAGHVPRGADVQHDLFQRPERHRHCRVCAL